VRRWPRYGKDHYSDYYSHKPQTRFQKTLESTLPFAPTTYGDTFNRCLTEFDDRHAPKDDSANNMTRTKMLRARVQAEEEVLTKKIQKGWTESIDRLRPKPGGPKAPQVREGYVENPKHKSRSEILHSRQQKRRPKEGYDVDDTEGVRHRAPLLLAAMLSRARPQTVFASGSVEAMPRQSLPPER
jgi:hypothetical protein